MASRRFEWQRLSDGLGASSEVGTTSLRVWRDTDQRKGFVWEMIGYAPDRDKAFEAIERATLASLSLEPEISEEWLRDLTRRAHDTTAYLMIDGMRDTRLLMTLCKLALEGLHQPFAKSAPPTLVSRKKKQSKERT